MMGASSAALFAVAVFLLQGRREKGERGKSNAMEVGKQALNKPLPTI
jgi:hypothetical protein